MQKLKEADNNSAVAFGGTVRQNPPTGGGGAVQEEQPSVIEGKESTITVTANGLNMGQGKPVDKDGNELADFKDPKFAAGGHIMKYTSGDKVMYQITLKGNVNTMSEGVKLYADSIEAVTKMKSDFDAAVAKLKKDGDKAANVAA